MNERIREVRKNAGLSMLAFGERIGISSAAVSNIENKKNNVSNQTIKLISKEFGVREEWIISGEEPMYENNREGMMIYEWAGETLAEGDPFKLRLLELLSKLSPEQWDDLKKMAEYLSGKDE